MKTPFLMISVINGEESLAALEGGADLIDIKNPLEGALGAPAPGSIQDVCAVLEGKKPFSIALGQFPGKPGAAALAALGCAYFKPDYVKIAFIPHVSRSEILGTLKEIRKSLNYVMDQQKISLVSVAFADTMGYASWDLNDFATISREGGAEGCLIDTWEKKGKSLLNYLSWKEIEQFIDDCHRQNLFCGLAGSLRSSEVLALSSLKADIIGVRSAVCGGDRLGGTVSPQEVEELKKLICRSKR